MLTARSTPEDIARFYERNSERVYALEGRYYQQMRQWCVRNRKPSMDRSGVHTIEGTKVAFLCRYERGKTGLVTYKYAYIAETNEWITKQYGKYEASALTAHCLHRYSERALGQTGMTAEKVMMQMVKRNGLYIVVYADEKDNFVRACRDGIFLGRRDNARSVEVFKTFVSMEMLKQTQRAAYDEVQSLFLKQGFTATDVLDKTVAIDIRRCGMYSDVMLYSKISRAYDIYADFFKSKKL